MYVYIGVDVVIEAAPRLYCTYVWNTSVPVESYVTLEPREIEIAESD